MSSSQSDVRGASTSLITGYSVRDLLFRPRIEEYFNTSSYVGLQHKFGNRLTVAALAEDLRSWRVSNTQYAIAQALLPGGRFDFRATPRWNVSGLVRSLPWRGLSRL